MSNNDAMANPDVSIIILNFNGGQHILNCIESIYKTTKNFEIILIDNNSTDNSENICKNKFPDIILIRNPINEGMSARNIGLKSANGKYTIFLDSDTIVTESWIEEFVRSFEDHGPGLYGPKFLKTGKEN
ncbi:MAG: glycosyltransferase, partial [Nitrosarchaeum sp.]|nr:glycosyltransferase [Nitrosarchaeum sp.]